MMQLCGSESSNKHSLINVMNRFIAAANNMDETIMVPSLLKDVPLEEQESADPVVVVNNNNNEPVPNGKQRDMYEHYLLLKSIKNDMEWGLFKKDGSGASSFLEMALKQEEQQQQQQEGGGRGETPGEETSDLEGQFHFHLRGLFGVLSKLTVQADHLTNRYKREIGGGNFIR
ncbi:mid1-interacting protein 1-like [Anguilla rostrata]|uniref:mid1-interacting protein 1-like n=1 Tax=Anguilla rostrata TaxID=7938 RepID=UPI0030D15CDD